MKIGIIFGISLFVTYISKILYHLSFTIQSHLNFLGKIVSHLFSNPKLKKLTFSLFFDKIASGNPSYSLFSLNDKIRCFYCFHKSFFVNFIFIFSNFIYKKY